MAELNCVSKKTLRLYREMGLLAKPVQVDEVTGYCFYSYDQCSTIDMIQQLQTLGISLAEIKELLEGDDSADIVELLEEHRRAIDQEMLRLLIARQNVSQLLSNYRRFMKHPLFDTVDPEHMPVRQVLTFDIFNPKARVLDDDATWFLEEWELNLRYTKRHMQVPGNSAFAVPPCGVSHSQGGQPAERRDFTLDASFIFVDDEEVARSLHAEECPCGDYLTLFKSSYSDEGRHNTEVSGLNLLLDYAEERGLTVAGDYYGEIIAETPAFHYEGREMLYKLEAPVLLDDEV